MGCLSEGELLNVHHSVGICGASFNLEAGGVLGLISSNRNTHRPVKYPAILFHLTICQGWLRHGSSTTPVKPIRAHTKGMIDHGANGKTIVRQTYSGYSLPVSPC